LYRLEDARAGTIKWKPRVHVAFAEVYSNVLISDVVEFYPEGDARKYFSKVVLELCPVFPAVE
jgi:hypothetical protein